jgi:site-specific DNA-methyltransferase (adenine-specific)
VELRDFQAFGEPGAIVYLADCVDLMKTIPSGSVDVVFADPPYRLSRGGVTVKNGRLAPVDKGAWDRSIGFAGDHRFNVRWLKEACRILKPEGTIWVTGTHHIIFSLGFALQTMKLKLIKHVCTGIHPKPLLQILLCSFRELVPLFHVGRTRRKPCRRVSEEPVGA